MSKPAYMRNPPSPISVAVKAEELAKYVFTITNNEQQFPKSMRYTISKDLRNAATDIVKYSYLAVSIVPKYKKQLKRRNKYKQKLYDAIIVFKAMLNMSAAVAYIKNPEHLATLTSEMIQSFDKLIKHDARKYKNIPTKKEYRKSIQESIQRKKVHHLIEQRDSMNRNEQGFIVLTPKLPSEMITSQ